VKLTSRPPPVAQSKAVQERL
jgi:hypothetical protein